MAVQASQRQPEPAIVSSAPCSGVCLSSASKWFGFVISSCRPSTSSSLSLPYQALRQGTNIPLLLPLFVSTFNARVQALVSSSGHAFSGVSAQLPLLNVNSLAEQLFMVGLGFCPSWPSLFRKSEAENSSTCQNF